MGPSAIAWIGARGTAALLRDCGLARPVDLFPSTWPALAALAVIGLGFAAAVWRKYPYAYTMALLCIGVFVLQMAGPRCSVPALGLRSDCVLAELSLIAPLVADGQRLLTPLTYMFVHGDLLHLAGNLFILLTAGPALEERIGHRNFLLVYLVAGLAAAAATMGLWSIGYFQGAGEFSPNVGASGAIFGVLTAFAVLFPREKLPMVLPMMFFVFWMPAVTVLLLHLAFNVVYFLGAGGNVAWWGHFAGFFAGFALAPLLLRRLPARKATAPLDVDIEALRPLAQSNVQRSALRELERLRGHLAQDDRALAEVWWERFVAQAQCPACQRKLEARDGKLACPNGDYEVQAMRSG